MFVGQASKRWTPADEELGRQLLASGASDEEFRAKLGRSKNATYMHFYYAKSERATRWERPGRKKAQVIEEGNDIEPGTAGQVYTVARPTEALLAEAQARARARDLQTITAAQCGDPPPGYSALDKIRKNQCAGS